MADDPKLPAPRDEARALLAMVERAERGDVGSFEELRAIVGRDAALWTSLADLAGNAERTWVRLIAGSNHVLAEATRQQLRTMKEELAGPSPAPAERLLVDRIAVTWVQVQYAEAKFARSLERGAPAWEDVAGHQKWIDRASRRHLAAIRTLATVRRLLAPAVQVNVGTNQLNVAR